MQAIISIFSKSKQTKTDKASGEKHTSIATRTIDTLTYTVEDGLPIGKALARINHFASQAIGARYKAFLSADKKLPSKLLFSITIDGKVYSSETALVKANMVNLVAVSSKDVHGKDGNMLDGAAIIAKVSAIQKTALKTSVAYLADIAKIAKDCEAFEGEAIKASTMLVTKAGALASSVVDTPVVVD
jgi:hypothetical protein